MAFIPQHGSVLSYRPAKQVEYGPNTILTEKEVQERKEALQKVTDDQLLKCKKLLVEGGESLTALVVGDTGTGKSTLINTLLGKDIADVDSGPSAVTKDLKHYTGYVGKVSITVVEVPHLEMEGMRINMHNLQTYCPNGVDMVYVCKKLYERHTPSAVETLRRLSVVFGKEVYTKAVFVMTFANEVPKSWGRKTDKETLRKKLERDWYDQATTIRAELQRQLHMTTEEAQKTLILPAGYYDKDDPESSRQILNLTNDWVYDLMLASVNANIAASRESSKSSSSSKQVAAPALLRIMASQVNEDFSDTQYASSGYGSKYSSSGTHMSSGDHDCQFSGYVFEYLGGISQCLSGLDRCTFEKVVAMVREVATTIFCVAELCSAIGKILEAIYNTGAVVAAAIVVGAVAGLVVCAVSAIVIATLVITILSVILTILVAISMGLMVLAAGAVGAAVGGVVGAVVGSIVPGVGTAAGAAVGGFIGGAIGAGGTLAGFFGYGQ